MAPHTAIAAPFSRPPSPQRKNSRTKGTDMKTVLTAMLLSFFLAANAESQEAPKVKVAVVNIQRMMNNGMNYDKIRLLSLDKSTLEALKKINTEIQEVQTQIVDVNDEVKLMDLGKRLDFLNRKSVLLRQRAMNGDTGRDMQATLRKFVVDRFKDKYALILQQQDTGNPERDRVLWKGDTEVRDITDDAAEEFQKYVDELVGDTGRPGSHRRSLISK
jgi:hypothetical protein